MSKMAAIHKLSLDTVSLFVNRSAQSSPSQSEKREEVRRSRSNNSSPIPRRMELSRALSTDNQLFDGKSIVQTLASPILARESRYSRDNIFDGSEDSPSMSNTDDETRERKTAKCDENSLDNSEKKHKKKTSLVKNFLVNRLRSGSWQASSSSDSLKNLHETERQRSDSPGAHDERKSVPGSRGDSMQQDSRSKELTGLIKHVLDSHLRNENYDSNRASSKCGILSKVLEKAVKSRLNTEAKNYKISALVFLGEIKDSGIKMATQCAWEPNQDHFAMATFESEQLFASAMVFAVEYDEGQDTGFSQCETKQ